jgi:hypothetical protein
MAFRARALSLLLALLLGASGAHAQHRWNAKEKHWYKDLLWWVGEGVIVAAFVLDAHSTVLVRERCPGCREMNPLLGPHPSTRAIVVDGSILFALQTGLHIASWKACPDPNWDDKRWRTACYTLIPGLTAIKFPAAAHNYHIAAQHKTSLVQAASTNLLRQMPSATSAQFALPEQEMSRSFSSFLPKRFSGCGLNETLCASFPQTAGPKRDLRSVQFR